MFKIALVAFACISAVVIADHNGEFSECCSGKNVPQKCMQLCTYAASSVSHFFTNECKTQEVVTAILQCEQRGKNNRKCCKDAGVSKEFDYCHDLCDGSKAIVLNEKYIHCINEENRNKIKKCGQHA